MVVSNRDQTHMGKINIAKPAEDLHSIKHISTEKYYYLCRLALKNIIIYYLFWVSVFLLQ